MQILLGLTVEPPQALVLFGFDAFFRAPLVCKPPQALDESGMTHLAEHCEGLVDGLALKSAGLTSSVAGGSLLENMSGI